MAHVIKKSKYDALRKYLLQIKVVEDLGSLPHLKYVTPVVISGLEDLMSVADKLYTINLPIDKYIEKCDKDALQLRRIKERIGGIENLNKRYDFIHGDKTTPAYKEGMTSLWVELRRIGDILNKID